jgi:hypothetical protein
MPTIEIILKTTPKMGVKQSPIYGGGVDYLTNYPVVEIVLQNNCNRSRV